jgi:hypothetical protein
MATPDSLRYVEGELNYLVPMPERPRYYAYDAGPDAPPTNMAHEAHTVRIRDMRPISSEVALDRQGFALVEQRTAVRDFWDEDEVRRVYYPEAERFIAEVTGASRVFIFDHLQRRRVPGAARRTPGVPPQPASRVHVDHTAKSGPQRVRDLLPDDAEELLHGRVLFGHLQPGARLVLCAGDAARRSAAAQVLRHEDGRARAFHGAHLVHRPDDPRRCTAA